MLLLAKPSRKWALWASLTKLGNPMALCRGVVLRDSRRRTKQSICWDQTCQAAHWPLRTTSVWRKRNPNICQFTTNLCTKSDSGVLAKSGKYSTGSLPTIMSWRRSTNASNSRLTQGHWERQCSEHLEWEESSFEAQSSFSCQHEMGLSGSEQSVPNHGLLERSWSSVPHLLQGGIQRVRNKIYYCLPYTSSWRNPLSWYYPSGHQTWKSSLGGDRICKAHRFRDS